MATWKLQAGDDEPLCTTSAERGSGVITVHIPSANPVGITVAQAEQWRAHLAGAIAEARFGAPS